MRVSHDGLSKLNSMRPAAERAPAGGGAPVGVGGRPGPVDIPGRSGVSRRGIPRESKSRGRRRERFRSGSRSGASLERR
jgi:hypothetical protein